MSTLVVSESKLFSLSQVLLGCANDIVRVSGVEFDVDEPRCVDLMVNGFRRATMRDLFKHIEASEKPYSFDWVLKSDFVENDLEIMDCYIDIPGASVGVRITMIYTPDENFVEFDVEMTEDSFVLTDEYKAKSERKIAAFTENLKILCEAADLDVEFSEAISY